MGLQITTDQITTMAPDASSMSAGKKLANARHWRNLGQNAEALWGECQGSALYQIRIDVSSFSIHCNCPSRKQPCKHGLGLLLLATGSPTEVPESEAPEWVTAWLSRRAASAKRKETLSNRPADAPPSQAQAKTLEKRKVQVAQGLAQLDLWLNDLMRNGLSSVETQPITFWEQQAKRMVDAQASGVAARIRRMAELPNASADWPERLLTQCGQLALLTHAYQRIDELSPALQEDVRQMIGWSLKEDEVLAQGERVSDDWLFLGQAVEEIERGKAQRTWLLGLSSGRAAMLLQFSIAGTPFGAKYLCGVHQQAELVYWPGAAPQRAVIGKREGSVVPLEGPLPGVETIDEFLGNVAAILALQPWQERFLCVLHSVIPVCKNSGTSLQCWVRDSKGSALPLASGEHWPLLACSGGAPVDFVGEWNGETLVPLGVLKDNRYSLFVEEGTLWKIL